MRVLSLFSGIGAFEKALINLDIPFELIGFSEIDRFASKSYCAIHCADEKLNLGDIRKVDETKISKGIDLVTYGFPCQDISLAGKQKGLFNDDGTQTRSGLFFEALRIIEETHPAVAIAENVKNLVGKRFKGQFEIVLKFLKNAGYNNYWKVLNLKDFGIPQKRERVFIVSIRKDLDNGTFNFPTGFPLKLRLKDMLEEEVDEKFFIKSFDSLTAVNADYAMINGGSIGKMHDVSRRAYNENGLAPTIHTCGGGNTEPKVIAGIGKRKSNGDQQWYQQDRVYSDNIAISIATGFNPYYATAMRDRYDESGKIKQKIEVSDREICNAITTVQKDSLVSSTLCVRKLTPKECWRLMGFTDEDFEKAKSVCSNSQLYKQAGNSVGVPVIEHIYKKLIESGVFDKCLNKKP